MNIIPLQPIPAQSFGVMLGGLSCRLSVYQKSTGMYLDLSIEGASVILGVLCHDRVLLVRQAYLGFVGDLAFIDTQGTSDPVYGDLGTRYQLLYLTPGDVSAST